MKLTLEVEKFLKIIAALEAERAMRECAAISVDEPALRIDFTGTPDPQVELSILLPVWNPDKRQLGRCLASIKAADLAGISHEVVVSDNASGNDSVRECLAAAGLPQVRYHRQPVNIGGFPNFNWCIGAARGRWLHLLSHDDWVAPAFYRNLLRGRAAASDTALRFCRATIHDETSGRSGLMFDEAKTEGVLPEFMERQACSQRIQLVGAVFSRHAAEVIGGFDPTLGPGADWEYWARLGSRFPVYYHPEQLATYVLHQASWTQREGNGENAESFRLMRRILLRILRHLPPERRRPGASGFMLNMLQRLVEAARRNKQAGRIGRNHAIAGALLGASTEAGPPARYRDGPGQPQLTMPAPRSLLGGMQGGVS